MPLLKTPNWKQRAYFCNPPIGKKVVTCGSKLPVRKDTIPNGTKGGDGHLAVGAGHLRPKPFERLISTPALQVFLDTFGNMRIAPKVLAIGENRVTSLDIGVGEEHNMGHSNGRQLI